jgi:hypothetical protein
MGGMVTGVQMAVRVLWLALIVLGILFWTGNATSLVDVHMLLGLILAVLLAVLAVLAGVRGGGPALLLGGLAVAVLLPLVGVGQRGWLPGQQHWAVEVLHLLVGLAAISVAEVTAGRLRRQAAGAL